MKRVMDMGRIKINRHMKESGLSLVEVLASIVILSLILITFTMMFLYSAKTGKTSENIIDATYVAQTEMEKIYAASKGTDTASDIGYAPDSLPLSRSSSPSGNWNTYTKKSDDGEFEIDFYVEVNGEDLKRIIVDVFEEGIHRARMQNVLVWRNE